MSQNPPVNTTSYAPQNFLVADIIPNGIHTLVETVTSHDYVVGQNVRFHVKKPYGMFQIDEKTAKVVSIPTSTTFNCDIDCSDFDVFIPEPTYPGPVRAQVSAIGDFNNTTEDLTISGAFKKI